MANNNVEKMDLNSFYIQILREDGLKRNNRNEDEFTQVDITVPPLHGDHFASSCDYVTVHRKTGEPIEIFVKRLTENAEHNENLKGMMLFDREAGFFNEIFPDLKKFIESKITSGTNNYNFNSLAPKCFFADKERIVLENITKRGYILLDKVERQDLNNARMVLKSLAKFHAPSYLLMSEKNYKMSPDALLLKYPFLSEPFADENGPSRNLIMGWMVPALRTVSQILEKHPRDNTGKALNILADLSENLPTRLREYYTLSDDDVCHVINHGDCWNSNMMFQQDATTGLITDHIFVDFQVVRIGSPNLDIGYYLFTSVKHEVRQKELKNLLRFYYDSLVENVEILNGKVTFSFEDLMADFKKKFLPGFLFGLAMGGMAEAMKDVGNLDDIEGDIMIHIMGVIARWIDNNPEIVERKSQELSSVFQEYFQILNL